MFFFSQETIYHMRTEMRQSLALLSTGMLNVIIKPYIQYACFWFLIFDNYILWAVFVRTNTFPTTY